MSTFTRDVAADFRLCLLGVLDSAAREDGPDALNAGILQSAVRRFGHRPTRAETVAALDWLAGRGLVRLQDPQSTLPVASLTERGQAVARGRARAEGVRRPPLDDPMRDDDAD